MQKVYLLLRGNQQTGPFNLEELLQFDLKPFDLIWIEGRSAGWYYPQEIPSLQPHLSFLKQTPASSTPAPPLSSVEKPAEAVGPKKIFVAMPSNAIKEEPTPKPSFSPLFNYDNEKAKASETLQARQPEELRTTYAKSLEEIETHYVDRAYQKKTKKKTPVSVKGLVVACLIIGGAFASWQMLQSSDKNPAETLPEQTAFLPAANELPVNTTVEKVPSRQSGKLSASKKQKQNNALALIERKSASSKQEEQASQPEEKIVSNTAQGEEESAPETNETNNPAVEERKSGPDVVTEAPKEKKKLRDKIADLFKKNPEDRKEEAKPVEEDAGERRSV
ncbi:MAG TPA: hypothetical protein VER36_10260, partial [Flavisolibacter sp.]|nr:hypothetical protein [Flavisolibacter sp.]